MRLQALRGRGLVTNRLERASAKVQDGRGSLDHVAGAQNQMIQVVNRNDSLLNVAVVGRRPIARHQSCLEPQAILPIFEDA